MPFSIPVTKTLHKSYKLYTCKLFGRSDVQNLIIYSHGIYEPITSRMPKHDTILSKFNYLEVPPWTSLYFYHPDELILNVSLRWFMEGACEPLEIYRPGEKVINYSLDAVTDCVVPPKTRLFHDRWLTPNKNGKKHPSWLYEILCPIVSTTLRSVLFTLELKRYLYPMIHCLFCRAQSHEAHVYNPGMVLPPNIYPSKVGRWLIVDDHDIVEVDDRGVELK